uniref:Uncharacterized protein n=1 Tax=Glossina palpalis gambiensis TaxID=67801 RepID=A0A1B0AXG5_9MUSC
MTVPLKRQYRRCQAPYPETSSYILRKPSYSTDIESSQLTFISYTSLRRRTSGNFTASNPGKFFEFSIPGVRLVFRLYPCIKAATLARTFLSVLHLFNRRFRVLSICLFAVILSEAMHFMRPLLGKSGLGGGMDDNLPDAFIL